MDSLPSEEPGKSSTKQSKNYSFIEELGFSSSSFFKDPFNLKEGSRTLLSSKSVISGLLDLNAKLSSVFWMWVPTVPSKEGAQGNRFWGTVWEHHPASPTYTLLGSAWIRRMGTISQFQMLFSDRSDMRSRAEMGVCGWKIPKRNHNGTLAKPTWQGSLKRSSPQPLGGSTDSKTLDYQRTNPREYKRVRTHTKETSWIQDSASPNHQQHPPVAQDISSKQQTQQNNKPNHQTGSPPHSALPIRGKTKTQHKSHPLWSLHKPQDKP